MLGHNECIFKLFQFTDKLRTAEDGTHIILPKDDVIGIIISAFQSCEFGFGHKMSDNQLEQVNKNI